MLRGLRVLFWVACCCFTLLPAGVQAEIFVLPERNPVAVGEAFTLTFSMNEQPDGNPDFSALNNDFQIIGTTQSSNLQMINGVVSRNIAWRVQLYAKNTGTLKIPAIRFGSESSPETEITVDKDSAIDGLQKDGIIVELTTDTKQPYVQQQIIVTQRLLHSVSLRQTGASMSHPEISAGKGLIQQLGTVTNSTENRKGVQYKVSERRYAVFPHTSGTLTLGRTIFQGILDSGNRQQRDPFGMGGRQIRRFSEPLTLEVRSQPANVKGTWLPAHSVSLNAYWQTPADQLKTGEPVTLTLAIIADGLMAEQLPEIVVKPPKGIKGYSNQPEFQNNQQGDALVGTRQERWILIGTAPGEYTLPEISLNWWNLKTGQPETATIPAKKVVVTGEAPENNAEDPAAMGGNSNGNNAERTDEPLAPKPSVGDADSEPKSGPDAPPADDQSEQALLENPIGPEQTPVEKKRLRGLWLLAICLVALILLGILYRRKRQGAGREQQMRVNYLEQLELACQQHQAQKAYDALSDWVRQDLQLKPPTIAQLRQQADLPLKQALDDLSMALYARQQETWQGEQLWQALHSFQQPGNGQKPRSSSDLLKLYPD